jgi:hypothetical protein
MLLLDKKRVALAKWLDIDLSDAKEFIADKYAPQELQDCFFIDSNGEAYAVIAPHEMELFVADYLFEYHENYPYSLENIAQSLNIEISEVENYFLPSIIVNDGTVEKHFNKHYVEGQNLSGFFKPYMDLPTFIKNYVKVLSENNALENVVLYEKEKVNGLNIYFIG